MPGAPSVPPPGPGLLLRELPAAAVDAVLAVAGPDTDCPQLMVELRQLGGALARPPAHRSAVSHRDAAYHLMTIGIAVPPLVDATAASAAAVAPWSDGATLPNFAPSEDPADVARRHDRTTLDRLARLATTYDPRGVLPEARVVRAAAAS